MRIIYKKEILESIIKESISWSEVCRKLDKRGGRVQNHIKQRAIYFNISFDHFLGNKFNVNKDLSKKDISKYLNNEIFINSNTLKYKLFKEKLKEEKCEECKNTHWLNEPIPLELHHIDNNHANNNLCNLKILCCNCHRIETKKSINNKKLNKKNKINIYRPKLNQRKVKERPSLEQLQCDIKELGYCGTGRKYDVSDNAIRKWIKIYNNWKN